MNILEVFKKFPQQEDCISYLERVRWDSVPRCPYCGSSNSTALPKEQRHHCNNCNTSYSVTVGTIFHRTHLPLQKWFLALSLILNAKKGISARQLARDIDVHRNTAWRISMKIREAMSQKHQRELLTGVVQMDETFIGSRKLRKEYPGQRFMDGNGHKKQPVVGMVERDGDVDPKMVGKRHLKPGNSIRSFAIRLISRTAYLSLTSTRVIAVSQSSCHIEQSITAYGMWLQMVKHTQTILSLSGLC